MSNLFSFRLPRVAVATTVAAFVAAGFLGFASSANAHQDPTGCTENGIGISLGVFRSDGTTAIGGGDTIAPGELIKYRATLTALGLPNCNFSGGTLSITTPDGTTDVSGGVIPLISVGSPFISAFVGYTVDPADIGGDNDIDASASYTGGVSHNTTGPHDSASGSVTKQTIVSGTIVIIKNAVPNDTQDFEFSRDFGINFFLDDDGNEGNTLQKQATFSGLAPGLYSVSEVNLPSGWQFDDVLCTDNSGGTSTVGMTANIDLAAGETVTCTFTNQKLAKIILVKQTTSGDDTFDFALTGGILPATDSLTTVSGTASETYDNLDPELTYSIAETPVPTGWVNTGSSCNNGDPINNITPNNGEVITCTFTNSPVSPLVIEKTASATFTRTFGWTIEKSVTPATWNLFTGDTGTSEYTVAITKDNGTDSNWAVTGTISITNPSGNPAANITNVADVLSISGAADSINCGVSFPYLLASGATLNCTYSDAPGSGTDQINTVTVTTDNGVPGGSDTADVDFGAPTTVVNNSVEVTDTVEGSLGIFSTGGSTTYSRTFGCDADEGTHNNTATITETDQNDSASVTVNCYDLQVTKTADESLDRKWTWTIDKVGDQTALTLAPGQVFPVNYDVTVNSGAPVDSNWAVSGTITVHNPGTIAATVNSVSDLITGPVPGTVVCPGDPGPYVIATGGDLICTYSASLPDGSTKTNTATVVQQNYDYPVLGAPVADGTTNYTGTASVDFGGATVSKIDECIDVTDPFGGGSLGTVCAGVDALPKTFEYTHDVGPYSDTACGTRDVVSNTASFVTTDDENDTDAGGSDIHEVLADIVCTCTLTQGYWKTHSTDGPAAHPDATWALLPGGLAQDTPFFTSGMTWLQVFNTPPAGNAWYNLAHQYMAAKLNILSGASAPASVTSAIASAEALFNNSAYNTPAEFAALGKKAKARKPAITWAGILGSYNEGVIGPGHCDEQIPPTQN